MNLIDFLKIKLRPFGKIYFLNSLSANSCILDVGCGNNSSYTVKRVQPNCHYTGIDISDYNLSKPLLADNYIITDSQSFADTIKNSGLFDAVISSHNLEHCNDRPSVLEAMLNVLKSDGKIFLSFPCEESINFDSRGGPGLGTLNYYDDQSHVLPPPVFDEVINQLVTSGFRILYSSKRYSPRILWTLGFLLEFYSKIMGRCVVGTWEYHGFESIIIAEKIS